MKSVWLSNYPYLLGAFRVYVCGHDLTVKNDIVDVDLMTGAMVFLSKMQLPYVENRKGVLTTVYRKLKRSRITFRHDVAAPPKWLWKSTPFWTKDVLTCDDMLQEIADNPHYWVKGRACPWA